LIFSKEIVTVDLSRIQELIKLNQLILRVLIWVVLLKSIRWLS